MSTLPTARTARRSPLGRMLRLCLLLLVFAPGVARAQEEPKRYGVRVSFAPEWTGEEKWNAVFGVGDTGPIRGTDFAIGFAKGRSQGGEWGVSYIRKKLEADGIVDHETNDCGPNCTSTFTETSTFNDVFLQGVEVHFSIPFVTVKRRIQAGISLGFGAGFPEGTVHQIFESSSTFPGGPGGQPTTQFNLEESDEPAKDVLFPVVPIIKVGGEVGVILAPGLKVRVGGGFNFPSQKAFHVTAVYLIGAD